MMRSLPSEFASRLPCGATRMTPCYPRDYRQAGTEGQLAKQAAPSELCCQACGHPRILLQWQREGEPATRLPTHLTLHSPATLKGLIEWVQGLIREGFLQKETHPLPAITSL